jgi:magnesium transporter
MIKAYCIEGTALKEINSTELRSNLDKVIWLDLVHPTLEEESFIEDLFGVDVPTREEMHEIELSSRLYQRNRTLFSTITLVTHSDTPHPESHPVTFILHDQYVITVRYVEKIPYEPLFTNTKLDYGLAQKGSFLLGIMLDLITEELADILENTTHKIEDVSHQIFKYSYTNGISKIGVPNFKSIIAQIGQNEDMLSKSRESLFTLTRMLGFILQSSYFQDHEDKKPITMVMRDVTYLTEHATFLSQKMTFLLDATLGMINIEQSSIIKIVSVAAVVFLPPTLVASIYGMNFNNMPELNWHVGYPFAILLMILSAFLPYRYFKYKGWL